MDGFVYITADTGDAHTPTVKTKCSVQIDGDIFDALAAVSNLHLDLDRSYDLARVYLISCTRKEAMTVFSVRTRIAANCKREKYALR